MLSLLIFAAFVFIYNSIVIVGGANSRCSSVAGSARLCPRPRRRDGQRGRYPGPILGPGLHLLIPFLYRTEKAPMMIVAENEVGLIDCIDGAPVPPGRIFGKALATTTCFRTARPSCGSGGEKGPQVQILPPAPTASTLISLRSSSGPRCASRTTRSASSSPPTANPSHPDVCSDGA